MVVMEILLSRYYSTAGYRERAASSTGLTTLIVLIGSKRSSVKLCERGNTYHREILVTGSRITPQEVTFQKPSPRTHEQKFTWQLRP
jgi:hypothetical protein